MRFKQTGDSAGRPHPDKICQAVFSRRPNSSFLRCFPAWAVITAGILILGMPAASGATPEIKVDSSDSLVHLGSIDSFDLTEGGVRAAGLLLAALRDKQPEKAIHALDIYQNIIPNENFGGEYTALQWFGQYLVGTPSVQKAMLQDDLAAEFHNFLGDNNYELLQEFLIRKYRLEKLGDENTFEAVRRETFLQDYILFNNPRREGWEQSSKMIQALNLEKGQTVVDLGCGPGFFTFKFADKVGPTGRVLALDINEMHTKYLEDLVSRWGVKNVTVSTSKFDDIGTPENVADVVWMCSLYHILYVLSTEAELDKFIGSIRRTLKPGGRFVVVDNALVKNSTLPYHGPFIAKELIIGQLQYYGFKLIETHEFIPQRYMLVFEKMPEPPAAAQVGPVDGTRELIAADRQ